MTARLFSDRAESIRALALATDATMTGPGAGQGGDSGTEGGSGGTGSGEGTQNGAQNGQGGSGSGSQGGGTGGTGSGTQGGTQGGTGGGNGSGSGSGSAGSGSGDLSGASHEDLVRMVGDLRRENATARTQAKDTAAQEARNALAQDIGKALGLVQGDEQADPEKLARDLAERDATLNVERVDNAAYRAAAKQGADPDALLDSAGFLAKAHKLDHTADDFRTRLDALIADEVKANTRVAAAGQAPARRSGSEFTGSGSSTPSGERPKSLRDAMRRAHQSS